MKIGMISCWYPYVGVSDYTCELIHALQLLINDRIEIISGDCYCQLRVGFLPRGECKWYPHIFNRLGKIFGRFKYPLTGVLRALWIYFTSRKKDIIHYQLCSGYFGFQILLFYLFLPKRNKIVVTFHELQFRSINSKFQQRLLSKIDEIIVHGQFSKEKLLDFFPFLHNKIKVIYHGVRIPRIEEYERKEIIFLGAPTRSRGIFYLLDAIKLLKNKNKSTILNIYGFGTEYEKKILRNYLRKHSLEENVSIRGILSDELFYQKLQESKFVILPRLEGHASGILLKAMACGTPIIATKVGDLPEYLEDAGIVVPLKKPHLLANAIQKLDENILLRQKIGTVGRKRAINLFSWDKIAIKTLEVYKNLVR